jgi:hypothetical protein
MSKHHLLPDIQSLDSSALLFTANHVTACSMLVAPGSRLGGYIVFGYAQWVSFIHQSKSAVFSKTVKALIFCIIAMMRKETLTRQLTEDPLRWWVTRLITAAVRDMAPVDL